METRAAHPHHQKHQGVPPPPLPPSPVLELPPIVCPQAIF